MSKMILWHGSPVIIEHPDLGKGKEHNDYGRGFYCTESVEMAKEWACAMPGQDGYANCYELDCTGMKILNLSEGRISCLKLAGNPGDEPGLSHIDTAWNRRKGIYHP